MLARPSRKRRVLAVTYGLSPILLTWFQLHDSMAVGQAEALRARLCVR